MVTWNNLNTLASFQTLSETERVDLVSAMTGESSRCTCKAGRGSSAWREVCSSLQWRSDQYRRETSRTSSYDPWTAWRGR